MNITFYGYPADKSQKAPQKYENMFICKVVQISCMAIIRSNFDFQKTKSMNSILAYFIGLLFGLIYISLFAGSFYIERIEKSIFGLIGFVCGTAIFVLLMFYLSFSLNFSASGSLATNTFFQLFIAVFFFISSFSFFGFLKFKKPKKSNPNSTKFEKIFSGMKVFFNLQFFWLILSAYFISVTTFKISSSVPLTFGGFYTAILFGFSSFGNKQTR